MSDEFLHLFLETRIASSMIKWFSFIRKHRVRWMSEIHSFKWLIISLKMWIAMPSHHRFEYCQITWDWARFHPFSHFPYSFLSLFSKLPFAWHFVVVAIAIIFHLPFLIPSPSPRLPPLPPSFLSCFHPTVSPPPLPFHPGPRLSPAPLTFPDTILVLSSSISSYSFLFSNSSSFSPPFLPFHPTLPFSPPPPSFASSTPNTRRQRWRVPSLYRLCRFHAFPFMCMCMCVCDGGIHQ